MKNILKYKVYTGSVVFDAEDKIFHDRLVIDAANKGMTLLTM